MNEMRPLSRRFKNTVPFDLQCEVTSERARTDPPSAVTLRNFHNDQWNSPYRQSVLRNFLSVADGLIFCSFDSRVMPAFLIQVSGHEIKERADPRYVEGAIGPRFCDEPLAHDAYFNATPFWKEEGYGRRRAWETVSEGDDVLLYCSGSVDERGACLSHHLTVDTVKVTEADGARLTFATKQELNPTISYADIQREVQAGRLSDAMAYCGQEGFNFTAIAEQDIARVNELSTRQADDTTEVDTGPSESLQAIADKYFSK